MAIAEISRQVITVGNTVTIPAGTTMAIGLCHRGTSPGIATPTLNGTPMTVGSIESDCVGIYYVDSPVAGDYTLGGNYAYFVYFSGTNGVRAGEINSTTATTPLVTTLPSSADDFVICNALVYNATYNSYSPTSIKIDSAEITYTSNHYEGFKQSSGDSPDIQVVFSSGAGLTLYYAFLSIKSLVASDQSTFMTMIM
jgi:hypothetical protein